MAAPASSAPGRARIRSSSRLKNAPTSCCVGIARQRQRHAHRQDVVGAQPGRHAHQVDEAPHDEAGGDQQRDGNGDLRDDQRGAQPSPHAVGRAAPAGGQRIDDAVARDLARPGRGRRRGRLPTASATVNASTGTFSCMSATRGSVDGSTISTSRWQASGDEQAERGAGEREHARFGEQLPNQPEPARAERGPHRQLAAADFAAREQQIRDVRACHQQDEADRRQKRQHDRLRRSQQIVAQRPQEDDPVRLCVLIGILALEAREHARHLGRGGVDRHARAQPRDRREVVAAAPAARRRADRTQSAATAPRAGSAPNSAGRAKRSGITPTTSCRLPSTTIVLPTIDGSAP